jgi:gamma-glutamyltranspeptidase/glutathione hydrolase
MIATVNPLASAAGLEVLRQGGNAIDAAIAAGAVLTVVEPWSGQLGGDGFLLIHTGSSESWAINGSGAAPAAATLKRYRDHGGIPQTGWRAATVPGLVDAWEVAAKRFGTRPLSSLLEPAIHYAESGFAVTARQAALNAEMAPVASGFPESAAIFLPAGLPLAPGDRLKQPDLARTLQAISRLGAATFYRGELADALVSASSAAGGLFSRADFETHASEVVRPIAAPYRGFAVLEQPPVSQGVIVLMALAILDRFELAGAPPDQTVHLQVEAHKLALAQRLQSLGDPRFVDVNMAVLLSGRRAGEMAARLDRDRAAPIGVPAETGADTSYLCVVDSDRNVVSYIHSLYGGNGVVAGDTGVLLNNRMRCFSLDETSPNVLGPGRRPMHTLNSWMLLEGSQPRYVGGTPGSFWQVQINLQLISALLDQGAGPREAVDWPRWTMGGQTDVNQSWLRLEGRLGEETAARLHQLGHPVELIGDWAAGGAAQIIQIGSDGLIGAGDPRPGTSTVLGL